MSTRWLKGLIGAALALSLALALGACEEDDSDTNSPPSEQDAAIDAGGAVGSAVDSAVSEANNSPYAREGSLLQQLAAAVRPLPGVGPVTGGAADPNQAAYSASGSVTLAGTYTCSGGGTVDINAIVTTSWEYEDGTDAVPAHWHQSWSTNGIDLVLTGCSEDGYTLTGTALFAGSNNFEFNQTAQGSDEYAFLIMVDEDSTADLVATHEASGVDFDLNLTWSLTGTITGESNVTTGDSAITSVNASATWSDTNWSCTGTWTDPDDDWDATCTFSN